MTKKICKNCKHWHEDARYPMGKCYQLWMQVTTAPEQTCKRWEPRAPAGSGPEWIDPVTRKLNYGAKEE